MRPLMNFFVALSISFSLLYGSYVSCAQDWEPAWEPDYYGCASCARPKGLWEREKLTGDWRGWRPAFVDSGITIESELTQFYQGVAKGGQEQAFWYAGKLDLYTLLDTQKMGLCRGGTVRIHAADWHYGENAITYSVDQLAPVNLNLMTPRARESFALTNLCYMQELGGGYVATAGRINALDFWKYLYPDYGRGVDGFMNMSMTLPMNAIPSLPLIFNTACLHKESKRGVEAGFLVMESHNVPEIVGLNFPNEVTLLALGRKFTDFGGLPGSHMLLATYAFGRYRSVDTEGWVIVPGGGVVPPLESGNWMAAYIGEQRLWVDSRNDERYTKVFGKFGFSDAITSPFHCTASLAVEAFGPMNHRPHDRMGIGYFYNGLNGPFLELYRRGGNPLEDVHGGEVYYNAQILPWFNLTADLQVINSAVQSVDTTIVFGLRGKMVF